MAISNELSSEIAAAILSEKKTPQELHALKNIVLEVHTALQKMSEEAHAASQKRTVYGEFVSDREPVFNPPVTPSEL